MLINDGKITMTQTEWVEFESITFAPWRPRSIAEFNAMCELGAARHKVENDNGQGWIHAVTCKSIKFSEDGRANFPEDKRRMAYVKVHGMWPTDEELAEFEGRGPGAPSPGPLRSV